MLDTGRDRRTDAKPRQAPFGCLFERVLLGLYRDSLRSNTKVLLCRHLPVKAKAPIRLYQRGIGQPEQSTLQILKLRGQRPQHEK